MTPTRNALYLFAAALAFSILVALVAPPWADIGLIPVILLLCVLALEWRTTPDRGDMEILVTEPKIAFVGETTDLVVDIQPLPGVSLGRIEVMVSVDDNFAELPNHPFMVAPEDDSRCVIPLQPVSRGMGHIETLWLRWLSPWGLLQRQAALEPDLSVPITPNLTPAYDQTVNMVVSSFQTVGMKTVAQTGDGSEFNALREYVAGADPRAIDWKRSARYQTLLSKEFETERNQQVVLAFDTGYLMCQKLDGLAKLDHAIKAALMLSQVCLRDGDRLGFMGFDAQIRNYAAPTGGIGSYQAIGDRLAHLDYSNDETNFTLATSHLLQQLQRRSLIILFTDFVDTVSASLMADNLARLSQHHLVIFVTIKDPFLERQAEQAPLDDSHVAESVVAASLLQDRRRLMRQLEIMGVRCLEVENHVTATALINEYLTVKRLELL